MRRVGKRGGNQTSKSSPLFWRALEDTEVFSGPSGTPIALVSEGSVVHEEFRYINQFDELWIATASQDGTTVWFAPFSKSSQSESDDDVDVGSQWEPTLEESAEISPTHTKLVEDTQALAFLSQLSRPNIPRHTDSMECTLELIGLYWQTVFELDKNAHGYRDWNLDYVQGVERALYSGDYTPLQHVLREFVDTVEKSVPALISDMFLPSSQRLFLTSKGKFGTAFFRGGIAFTLGVDQGGSRGGDECAMKGQSQSYHASQYLARIAPKYGVHTPLTLLMTFGGFRILASSIPPVQPKSETVLIEGSSTILPVGVSSSDVTSKTASQLVTLIAREAKLDANLKSSPYPFTVVAGCDCRLYAVDVSATLPCFAPPRRHRIYKAPIQGHFWRLRPEVLERMQGGLSCHAFLERDAKANPTEDSLHAIGESEAAIEVATDWLREDVIPTVSNVLGLIEPCHPDLELPSVDCVSCEKTISSKELRFLACRGEERCCVICPQCYINLLGAALEEERESSSDEEDATNEGNDGNATGDAPEAAALRRLSSPTISVAERLRSCVKCGSVGRGLKALELQPDIGSLFHAYGLNLRFMSAVYNRLPLSATNLVRHFLEVEMIARAAKHVLWRRLRLSNADPETIPSICEEFLSALLQPNGATAEALWGNEIGPAIEAAFDVFIPFDTEHLDVSLVYERVSELTGLEITAECFEKLLQPHEGLVLKLDQMAPVMKTLRMPVFTSCERFEKNDEVEGERVTPTTFLEEIESKMLLLWAGLQENMSQDLYKRYATSQPAYLQE